MRLAREAGATVLAVTNVMGSQATRDADAVLFTRAGLEIGVAATKTFVSQVAAMYLLGLKLAAVRGALPDDELKRLIDELKRLPHLMTELLERVDEPIQAIAKHWKDSEFFLYLGRHVGLPVALEGALKLKEISYIPTDAYAAGEMKHGPIALLDQSTPVVCVATDMPILDKVLVERRRGARAGRARDRDRDGWLARDGRADRRRGLRAEERLAAPADPRHRSAPAARVLHRHARAG